MSECCYRLIVYVPSTHANALLEALFAAGAGRIGAYDRCAWRTEGTGRFRPLPGNRAFLGETMRDEFVAESKLELVVAGSALRPVLDALKKHHPYETPAFQYWAVGTE